MKSEKGITLLALSIIIIILFILVGIGIIVSVDTMTEIRDDISYSELGAVRQLIYEQYAKAVTTNQTSEMVNDERVEFFEGELITSFSKIDLPDQSLIRNFDESIQEFYNRRTTYSINDKTYQEDCYYRLTANQLKRMGITGEIEDTYIVNYKTTEVYNETKKLNSQSELLYLPSTKIENISRESDTESFNDWK